MSTSIPISDSTPPKMVIQIHRATDQTRVFAFFEEVDGEEVEIDLVEAGYDDFWFEVRTRQNPNATALLRYTLDNGLEITDTNTLTLTIPKEDTLDIEGGVYWFDLLCERNSQVYALIQGRFEINNNVTLTELQS